MAPGFIHLHNHSEFSILDGAVRLDALAQAAVDNMMPAVALTDHGNLFGAVKFQKIAKEKGVKPIFGCEAYIAPRSRHDRETRDGEPPHYHLLLLVENEIGYKNLCVLLSKAYLEGFYYRPRIDKELLAAHSKGLIGFSACLRGEVAYLLGQGRDEAAYKAAGTYSEIFGPKNFYIELMDHGLEPQRELNPKLVALARSLHLPLVATNDVHFLAKDDAESHDVLLCIQTNKKISDTDRIKFGSKEFYFKSQAEMEKLFGEIPEALENTFHIAARCDFQFPLGKRFLPHFDPPGGKSLRTYFEEIAWQGFAERSETLQPLWDAGKLAHGIEVYKARLEREIELVKEMQFEGYFLIVWDLLRTARSRGIPVGPGRGSAAGSLLAYCLRITDIDPIEYDLLFERFLNPERVNLPDIDMDFCARRRGEMIAYVTDKYGQDNVSQIITFGTMAARAAIRDVGRVMEIPLSEVDKVAKMVPLGPDVKLAGALRTEAPLKEYRDKNPKIQALLAIAEKVEGQVRHPSIHAAGLVITPRPLTEFVPLYQSVKGEVTTQFAMSEIEAIGLLKMDLLGLRNLTIIRDALDFITRDFGSAPNMETLPLDDAATFDLFKAGNTDGVFQFESTGMKALLRDYKPDQFRDLIALNALFRPGPLSSKMDQDFIDRKYHPEKIVYDVPELEPILKETRGLMLYQEQVMRIAVDLAGFTLGGADILRKAMGKKKAEIMVAQKDNFLNGAKKKGVISVPKAAKIFDQIARFAEYGFNKSHSAAYAALAYQTAYLKAHYPAYFMAALMTSEAERGATTQIVKYIAECQVLGLEVQPPDINASDFVFTVEDKKAVRFGLAGVKNVGETAARALVASSREKGKFKSLFDVVKDVDSRVVNRKVLESLIKAGAFDSLGIPRAQGFALIDALIDYNHDVQKTRESTQTLLFGGDGMEPPDIPADIRAISEWDEMARLANEKEALGLYLSGHPLSHYQRILSRLTSHSTDSFEEEADIPDEIRMAGVITDLQIKKTKKDERMAVFQLDDAVGRIEVVVYPDPYKRFYGAFQEGALVWVKGRHQMDGESHKLYLSQVMLLDEAAQKLAKKFVVRLPARDLEDAFLDEVYEVMDRFPGECPTLFEVEAATGHRVTLQTAELRGVTPTDELMTALEALLGPNSIRVDY